MTLSGVRVRRCLAMTLAERKGNLGSKPRKEPEAGKKPIIPQEGSLEVDQQRLSFFFFFCKKVESRNECDQHTHTNGVQEK